MPPRKKPAHQDSPFTYRDGIFSSALYPGLTTGEFEEQLFRQLQAAYHNEQQAAQGGIVGDMANFANSDVVYPAVNAQLWAHRRAFPEQYKDGGNPIRGILDALSAKYGKPWDKRSAETLSRTGKTK